MTTRDACPVFPDRCCSRLPIKIPHVKYKDRKTYSCCCPRVYSTACGEDDNEDIVPESGRETSCHRMLKNLVRVDKSTQMSIKSFYESYILEGLLNTSEVKRNYSRVNNADILTDDIDYLSDIRNILMTTNDKLDLILSALADKKELIINTLGKQRKSKNKVKSEGVKSTSNVSLRLTRNDMSEMACHMCPWAKCISSTCLARLRPNPFYISPYFPPYYVKPISHYNYFKIFGPKYSDPDMTNNLWSPFMFMASNFNVKKLQDGINKEKMAYQLDDNGNPLGYDEESAEHVGYSEETTRGRIAREEDIEENYHELNPT